jgi:hypothetical protein
LNVDPRALAAMREIAAAAYDAAARFDQLDAADAEATYRRLRAAAAELKSIPTKLYIGGEWVD